MAVAALLLVAGALAVGGGGFLYNRGKPQEAKWSAIGGGVAMLLAVIVFLLRPNGNSATAEGGFDVPEASPTPIAAQPAGKLLCTFVPDRSRITVSNPQDVELDWSGQGCLSGRTQYVGGDAGKWTRLLIPNTEQTVSVAQYDPVTRTYTSLRYFLGADQMDAIRKMRAQTPAKECSADPQALRDLAAQQNEIRATLPPTYSEKLVYTCKPAS